MKLSDIPSDIAKILAIPLRSGHAVWLIGSRANGTAAPTSDWDFIVFGGQSVEKQISTQSPIPNLDLFVVLDGDHFRHPWLVTTNGIPKGGSLVAWHWKQESNERCSYIGQKEDEWDIPQIAIKVRD